MSKIEQVEKSLRDSMEQNIKKNIVAAFPLNTLELQQ